MLCGERTREEALRRYARFSASHSRAFRLALRLQCSCAPAAARAHARAALARQALVDRAFGWYLDQAHPDFVGADRPAGTRVIQVIPGRAPRTGAGGTLKRSVQLKSRKLR